MPRRSPKISRPKGPTEEKRHVEEEYRTTPDPITLDVQNKCMDHVDRRFEDLKKGQEQRFAKLYQRFKEQDRCYKDQDLRQETWLFEIVRRRGFY